MTEDTHTDLYVTKVESDYDWDTDAPLIRLYGRTEGNYAEEILVRGYYPRFYAARGHDVGVGDHEDIVSIEPSADQTIFGEAVDCVTYRKDFRKTREEIKQLFGDTYEVRHKHTNRFLIDHDISTGVRVPSNDCFHDEIEPVDFTADLRIVTFDIETDDRGSFPDPGEARILSIAAHDNYSDETTAWYDLDGDSIEETFDIPSVTEDTRLSEIGDFGDVDSTDFCPDEKTMLKHFADYVSEVDPDVLTAWNVKFDAGQTVGRMEEIGVDSDRLSRMGNTYMTNKGDTVIQGRTVFDLLYNYKKSQLTELSSYSLNSVAEAELGTEKVDHTGMGFFEMYEEDPELFLRYNVMDVELAVGIDRESGVFDFKQALRHEVGLELHETRDNHTMIEMFARRELHERGLIALDPSGGVDEEYDGAHVFPPYKGLTTNVTGVDLASLYPNTMAMFNMSPETKVSLPESLRDLPPQQVNGLLGTSYARAPNGQWFDLENEGIFAALVDKAIGLKEGYKKQLKKASGDAKEALQDSYDAAKAVTNSLYGVLGWVHFFLYDRDVALAITSAGVECIKRTERFFREDTDGEVIYGDTDSNYLEWPQDWDKEYVIETAKDACNTLNTAIYPELGAEMGVPEAQNRWEIVLESYAKTYFQHGKKKRYAMHITWDEGKEVDKKKITGYGRSDVSANTSDLIDNILKNIMDGLDEATISEYLMDAAAEVQPEGADLAALGIPGGLGQELEDYQWTNGTPKGAQPRGAYFSNKLLGTEFSQGSKPKRVYVKPYPALIDVDGVGETVEVDVLCFEDASELPDDLVLDIQRMEESGIINPVHPILEAAGVDTHAALRGQTQTGLGQFMGA